MTFIAPIAGLVAAAIAIPALVSLYFLKLRRRQLDVGSTLLWKKAIQDLQVNAPFQKMKRNLLLLLQLILLALLLLALAGPMWKMPFNPGKRTILVIDQSASMNATDESPTRLDAAKERALAMIGITDTGNTQQPGSVMVVSFAQHATVVQPFTSDVSLLRSAIRSIQPTDQPTNLAQAMKLVEPFAVRGSSGDTSGDDLSVYVFSDGRVGEGQTPTLRAGRLVFEQVGKARPEGGADNVAFISCSARRDYTNPQSVQVFAQLANYSTDAVSVNVTRTLDGQPIGVDKATLPPLGSTSPDEPGVVTLQYTLTLPGAAVLQLEHDHADALSSDNAVQVVIAPPQEVSVLLVSRGNAFLSRAVAASFIRRVVELTPEQYEGYNREQLAKADFDLVIFDSYTPKAVPPMDSLSFGCTPPLDGVVALAPPAGDDRAQYVLDWKRDDPLMNYVVLDDFVMASRTRLRLPIEGATVLATAEAGPVIAVIDGGTQSPGTRHVVTSFALLETNWPMQVSFAVFISNAMQTLGVGATGGNGIDFQPGDVATVPATDGQTLTYTGPTRLEGKGELGVVTLPMFNKVGLYRTTDKVAAPWDALAVNLTDPTESDLRPEPQLSVGTAPVKAQSRTLIASREIWRWFIWSALAMLVIEWLVYTRRMGL
ncbi:MAG: VWA domain-containing protein [Phycisphaera sp.]|nr:VWA domain-containing protein [Phycisphaera sp.]